MNQTMSKWRIVKGWAMQPTPRFADPSQEGSFMMRIELGKNPLPGGVPDVPCEVPTSLRVGTKQGGRGGWGRLYS